MTTMKFKQTNSERLPEAKADTETEANVLKMFAQKKKNGALKSVNQMKNTAER